MKTLAVIYTRVSSEEQVDNMSLGNQEDSCRDFVARQQGDLKVDRVFTEEGESAKSADRTKLKEMLEYCRENKHKVGHVVVYKLDRFARSVQDHMALQAILKKMDIILWSATEPIGETTTGKLMEHVLASFAQFDNDVRSERCRAGMKARALEGCWVVNAPIGYTNHKDELKRPTLKLGTEATVKAIRKFFDEYATGKYRQDEAPQVAKDCGIRTASGGLLSRTGAIGMLNNPVYAGSVKCNLTDNRSVKGLHPAIISEEQFRAVQDILNGRRRNYTKPSRFKLLYPLKRFLVCGQCGRPLAGSAPTGGSGNRHAAYHCPKCTIKRNGKRVSIDKEKAHKDFAERLDSLVPTDWALKVFKEIVIRRWDKEFRDVQEERRNIDKQLKKLEDRRNSLFDVLGDGEITDKKEFNRQIQRLEIQQETLEGERDQIKDTEVDKRKIINEAVYFMAHAGEIWRSATAENKVLFQKLVYEHGLPLYPDLNLGTSRVSVIYEQITVVEQELETNMAELPIENSAMVRPEGFEPPTFCSEDRRSNPLSYGR